MTTSRYLPSFIKVGDNGCHVPGQRFLSIENTDTKNSVSKFQLEKKTPPETKNSVYLNLLMLTITVNKRIIM
ncbi:hypothetical protein [Clostridium sp.]|uniref:hypothetical protein n=1 Tax=Clostridium sp. TaxID=1506 RepID=UPI0039E738C1